MRRRILLLLAFFCLQQTECRRISARQHTITTTTSKPKLLQDIQIIQFNERIGFHANDTKLHVRSGELWLGTKEDQCVEARLWVEGKRTRLDFGF